MCLKTSRPISATRDSSTGSFRNLASRPTDTSVSLMESIEKDLNGAKTDYRNLMDREVPAFNRAIGGAMTPLTGGRQ